MFRPRCSTKMYHVPRLSDASLQSLCKTKWLLKLRWGWRYVRSNVKTTKSLLWILLPSFPSYLIFTQIMFLQAAEHLAFQLSFIRVFLVENWLAKLRHIPTAGLLQFHVETEIWILLYLSFGYHLLTSKWMRYFIMWWLINLYLNLQHLRVQNIVTLSFALVQPLTRMAQW